MKKLDIRTADVIRYVKPLREGGSLPAIVEADDGFTYVLKFRGAGQGKKALIAELIGGELARAIGLKVPELVFLHLDDSFSKTEPDQEIQDLLRFSVGLNLGLHYLSGAITYDPLVSNVDPLTASKVVLLDSLISNIDRTHKNTNLLSWNQELWLIDHGASLYFHHSWDNWSDHLQKTFPMVRNHVLLGRASALEEAAGAINQAIDQETIRQIVAAVPDEWLKEESDQALAGEKRQVYEEILCAKLSNIGSLTKEASDARKESI
jgi:hypothetical protein